MANVPVVVALLALFLIPANAIFGASRRRPLTDSVPGQFLVTRVSGSTENLANQLRAARLDGLKILQEFRFDTLNTVLVEVKGNKNKIMNDINELSLVGCVQENYRMFGTTLVDNDNHKNRPAASAQETFSNPKNISRKGQVNYRQSNSNNTPRRSEKQSSKRRQKRMVNTPNASLCRGGLSHLPPGTNISDTWALQRISSRVRPPGKKRFDWADAYQRQDGYMEGGVGAGDGVAIYVLDTGVNLHHLEFFDGSTARGVWGFTASKFRETEGDVDGYGHGTHVASTAMGSHIGVARVANVTAVKVLDNTNVGDEGTAIEGLQWVYDQVRNQRSNGGAAKAIINMSLGLSRKDQAERCDALELVLTKVLEAGIPVVVAAGNSNQDACDWSPAGNPGVITVGASNPDDRIWHDSNWGRCVDILAPGEFVYGAATAQFANTRHYGRQDGTSHAAPLVTGVIAGYMSFLPPSTSPTRLKELVIERSTKDVLTGLARLKAETPNRLLFYECFDSKPF